MTTSDQGAREALLHFFTRNGLLLCNKSTRLPYLDLVGGDWNAIVSLLESGDAFYSRFFMDRVTYLSPELYFALKPYRRREDRLSDASKRLLTFLRVAGEANATQMQQECLLERKTQTLALNELVGELFITAIRRDVTIHTSWCSFVYAPAENWEQIFARANNVSCDYDAREILLRQLSQKQVDALLR